MKPSNILGKILFLLNIPILLIATPTLTLKVSQDSVYVGQTIEATLLLKYIKEDKVLDTDFDEFVSDNFWIQDINESDEISQNGNLYKTLTFNLSAQKAGILTIDKQQLRVSHREHKTNLIIWKDFYTKSKKIEVLPLPKDLTIQGKYNIKASVDKNKTDANKPINLTLTLEGYGNFNDIKSFDLNITKQLFYTSKPIFTTIFRDNKNQGVFSQKFSIIGDKDFTIPSISFKYFNRETKQIETIKTNPIKINILNQSKSYTSNRDDTILKYIFLGLGIIIGILISYIYFKFFKSKTNKKIELQINKQIKKAKNDKALYKILLAYSSTNEIDNIMKKLEDNIYKNSKHKINKKIIMEYISKDIVV